MDNISTIIREMFTNNISLGLGKILNEPEGNVSKALDAFIPSIIGGMFLFGRQQQEASIDAMITGAQNLLGGTNTSGVSVLENMAAGKSDYSYWIARGNSWIKTILGPQSKDFTAAITQHSGMKNTSTHTFMGLVMPFIIDIISQKTAENNAADLIELLQVQENNIKSAIPTEIGLAKILGISAPSSNTEKVTTDVEAIDKVSEPEKKESAWAWMLLIVLAALAIWFFVKGDSNMANLPADMEQGSNTEQITDSKDHENTEQSAANHQTKEDH